jgi:type II secretory pathway component PulF
MPCCRSRPLPLGGGLRSAGKTRFPLLLFSQELLSLLNSGISIVEAIETLAEKEQRPAMPADAAAHPERVA